MSSPQRVAEMAFELALLSALEDSHGLNVRADGDVLNRRRTGYATLRFRYEHPKARGGRRPARVHVSIVDGPPDTFAFDVDLDDADAREEVAGACEDLAFAVHTHLEEAGKPLALAHEGLRWDD